MISNFFFQIFQIFSLLAVIRVFNAHRGGAWELIAPVQLKALILHQFMWQWTVLNLSRFCSWGSSMEQLTEICLTQEDGLWWWNLLIHHILYEKPAIKAKFQKYFLNLVLLVHIISGYCNRILPVVLVIKCNWFKHFPLSQCKIKLSLIESTDKLLLSSLYVTHKVN